MHIPLGLFLLAAAQSAGDVEDALSKDTVEVEATPIGKSLFAALATRDGKVCELLVVEMKGKTPTVLARETVHKDSDEALCEMEAEKIKIGRQPVLLINASVGEEGEYEGYRSVVDAARVSLYRYEAGALETLLVLEPSAAEASEGGHFEMTETISVTMSKKRHRGVRGLVVSRVGNITEELRNLREKRIDETERYTWDGARFSRDRPTLRVASVKASSTLKPKGKRYRAVNVVDGTTTSAWVEGKKGAGIGEWVEIRFPTDTHLAALELTPGLASSASGFQNNNRPARVEVQMGAWKKEFAIRDEPKAQRLTLEGAPPATAVRVTLKAVHKGKKYDDTCIAEIRLR